MKFNITFKLRNIILTLYFISAYFNANAFDMTICVRLDSNFNQEDIDNYNSEVSTPNSWALMIPGGDVSARFTLPNVGSSNIDYCSTSSITVNDQAKPYLLAGQLMIHEYIGGGNPYAEDPAIIPGYALIAFKNCKIELNAKLTNSLLKRTRSFFVATVPIQCNFLEDSASANKLKNSIAQINTKTKLAK